MALQRGGVAGLEPPGDMSSRRRQSRAPQPHQCPTVGCEAHTRQVGRMTPGALPAAAPYGSNSWRPPVIHHALKLALPPGIYAVDYRRPGHRSRLHLPLADLPAFAGAGRCQAATLFSDSAGSQHHSANPWPWAEAHGTVAAGISCCSWTTSTASAYHTPATRRPAIWTGWKAASCACC